MAGFWWAPSGRLIRVDQATGAAEFDPCLGSWRPVGAWWAALTALGDGVRVPPWRVSL